MATHLKLHIAIMLSVIIKVIIIIMIIPFTMVSICIIFTNGSRGWNKKTPDRKQRYGPWRVGFHVVHTQSHILPADVAARKERWV